MATILLIEDDKVLRENTQELLELAHYRVITAADGEAGIELASTTIPDVIICDIMMPEKDGYAVLSELAMRNETKYIPFIFLSAKTERGDVRKGMELGADDYITKPFKEEELLGAIKSRLARISILKETGSEHHGSLSQDASSIKTIHDLKNFIDDHGSERKFEFGESVYQEGDHSNMVFLVLEGMIKTHKLDEQGKELITGIHKPDDIFGLISFTKNIPFREYATAIEKSVVIGIHKGQIRELLEHNHELVMELMQLLAENLTETREQLLEMAYASVRKKTATTLLKFAEKLSSDNNENLHILRSDLAGVAGMATETLIRTLSSFKKEGLISIKDRNIQLLDTDRLRSIQ